MGASDLSGFRTTIRVPRMIQAPNWLYAAAILAFLAWSALKGHVGETIFFALLLAPFVLLAVYRALWKMEIGEDGVRISTWSAQRLIAWPDVAAIEHRYAIGGGDSTLFARYLVFELKSGEKRETSSLGATLCRQVETQMRAYLPDTVPVKEETYSQSLWRPLSVNQKVDGALDRGFRWFARVLVVVLLFLLAAAGIGKLLG